MSEIKLREVLKAAIDDANRKTKPFGKKVVTLMVHMYNVPVGDTRDILNGKLPVDGMSLDTMYKLMSVLYEANKTEEDSFSLEQLNVNKYFTDAQKRIFEQKIEEKELVGDIVFDNFLQLNPDQYLVVVPIDDIVRWRDSRRIKYNEKTQRKMTIREVNGEETKVVTLNSAARKDIHKLMENNEFISNALTLNVNPDYFEPPYVSKDGKLVIPEESEIDISDGFHRYLEMTSVKDTNPDWKFNSAFYITVFDEEKANKFIWQEDHKTHLKKEQRETMNKADNVNYLLDRLNSSDKFHLKGTLDQEKQYVMNKVINYLWDDEIDRKQAIRVYKEIEDSMNRLIEDNETYNEDFDKKDWFVCLAILKYALDNNIDFVDLFEKTKNKLAHNNFAFRNAPKKNQYDEIFKILEEAKLHV